jgi:hypothetical protein
VKGYQQTVQNASKLQFLPARGINYFTASSILRRRIVVETAQASGGLG